MTLLIAAPICAQQNSPVDVTRLVRETVYNELHPQNDGYRFMYRHTTISRKGSVTKQTVQTSEGPLSRTIAINGKPLNAEQSAKEDERLKKFANDSEARRKKEQSDKEESQREDLMVKTLPDAFVYTSVGSERGPRGGDIVHLNFKPNPSFNPPNHETQVYLGMEGDMYIDTRVKRLVKMDGSLFKEVNFGWGILGKLDKGGRFVIEQADIGNGVWETVNQTLKFTGKILMVKPLEIDSRDTLSDFRPVPSQLTTAQALSLLEKSDDVSAENGGGIAETPKRK